MFKNPSVCVQDREIYARKLSSPPLSLLLHIKCNIKFRILSYKSQPRESHKWGVLHLMAFKSKILSFSKTFVGEDVP